MNDVAVRFDLTPRQKEQRDAAASAARHVLAFGGSRSGKTFGFMYCIANRALMAPKSRHLVARLHNVDVRQAVLMDTWPTVLQLAFPGVEAEVNKTDQYVKFENDAEIWFGGLDDKERVDKVLGKEYATIYLNECSQLAYQTILTLRTRLAQNVKKSNGDPLKLKMYYDLNPVGQSHWSYIEFVLGRRPDNKEIRLTSGTRKHVIMNPTDNPHLSQDYIDELAELPERQRARFLEGKYMSDVPGTLWPQGRLTACRVEHAPPLGRIVVAVDPSGSDGVGGDTQGIVVAGTDTNRRVQDQHAYILEDGSIKGSPGEWGNRAVQLYRKYGADKIVAEKNYGGEMVRHVITQIDPTVNVVLVTATRGKHVRAEPVAALYEERGNVKPRIHHVGEYPELEEQLTAFTASGYAGAGSPDRADALVWAVTDLLLEYVAEKTPLIGRYAHAS